MYIVGSMVRINGYQKRIPIPWWHRAALGFQHGTQVFVGITESNGDRPGDILVSVLNLDHLGQLVAVRCPAQERPGVIEEALDGVQEWNIALAEAVTIEGGTTHHVDLICEPYRSLGGDVTPEKVAELRKKLGEQFEGAQVDPLPQFSSKVHWSRRGEVNHGWVHLSSEWRHIIDAQIARIRGPKDFDTSRLVLSVDTNTRVFRAVIPRCGALSVEIEHADEPGVLRKLTKALKNAGVNVLSMLLKRGGAAASNAILVAVCEPSPKGGKNNLKARIENELNKLPHELRAAWKIDDGREPLEVTYGYHPEDVIIRVPKLISARVLERRASFCSETHLPVFLSRRFSIGPMADTYANKVREVLKKNNCVCVEGEVLPGGTELSMTEVSSAMWASKAGIVMVVEPENSESAPIGLNLAHEYGFLDGQGKPLLLLVEESERVRREFDAWANIRGVTAPWFDRVHALIDGNPRSIELCVSRWLADLAGKDVVGAWQGPKPPV